MKRIILAIFAALTFASLHPAEVEAQLTVWENGRSVYSSWSDVDSVVCGRWDWYVYQDGVERYSDGFYSNIIYEMTFEYAHVGTPAGKAPAESAAVDLGLTSGTLWAPYDIGSTDPEENGASFSWGDIWAYKVTETRSESWPSYEYSGISEYYLDKYTFEDGQTKGDWYEPAFIGDNKTRLEEEDDVAAQNWGGGWVMPTCEEFKELFDNCTSEWKDTGWDGQGSEAGCFLTSKINGKTLFLPAGGMCRDYGPINDKYTRDSPDLYYYSYAKTGYYWTSDLYSNPTSSSYFNSTAEAYYYAVNNYTVENKGGASKGDNYRCFGLTVRPVRHSADETTPYKSTSTTYPAPTAEQAVDLGLPFGTLWAPWNVGHNSHTHKYCGGKYYAWGEVEPRKDYTKYGDFTNYKYSNNNKYSGITKYQIDDHGYSGVWYSTTDFSFVGDSKTTLEADDDAAAKHWGGNWVMPTAAQFKELYTECDYEIVMDGSSIKGIRFTSKKNGNTLYLPRGEYWGNGHYWTSELSSDLSWKAMAFHFYDSSEDPNVEVRSTNRTFQYKIRPVLNKKSK